MWDSRWSLRTATFRGYAWSWKKAWAGRPVSRRRWNDCSNPHSCSSPSAPVPAAADQRYVLGDRLAGAQPAGLFDRQLVGEQFGERESPCGTVILAEQIEPLDRSQDAFGHGVASLRRHQQPAVTGIGDV